MTDPHKLTIPKIKEELDARGIEYKSTMKKAELVHLLEVALAATSNTDAAAADDATAASTLTVHAGDDVAVALTEEAPAEEGKAAPSLAVAESEPAPEPASNQTEAVVEAAREEAATHAEPEPASETTTAEPEKAAAPPKEDFEMQEGPGVAFNSSEMPLPKTEAQIAEEKQAEILGAGPGGAEGAVAAGIALTPVEASLAPQAAAPSTKRPLSPEDSIPTADEGSFSSSAPKRAKVDLPSDAHPPTRSLYITNLRRPLPDAVLAEFLSSFGPLDTSAGVGRDSVGWWLSPVKSHAFVTYEDESSSSSAYAAIQGLTTFPPEAPQPTPPLEVSFLRSAAIPDLVTQEIEAWSSGRKKLDLQILSPDGDNDEWRLEYASAGANDLRKQVAPVGAAVRAKLDGGGGRYANGFGSGGRAPPPPSSSSFRAGYDRVPPPHHRAPPPPSSSNEASGYSYLGGYSRRDEPLPPRNNRYSAHPPSLSSGGEGPGGHTRAEPRLGWASGGRGGGYGRRSPPPPRSPPRQREMDPWERRREMTRTAVAGGPPRGGGGGGSPPRNGYDTRRSEDDRRRDFDRRERNDGGWGGRSGGHR